MIRDLLPLAFVKPDQRAPVDVPLGKWSGHELQATSDGQPRIVNKSGSPDDSTPRTQSGVSQRIIVRCDRLANCGSNSVGTNDEIGFDRGCVLESENRCPSVRNHSRAPSTENDGDVLHRGEQNLLEVGSQDHEIGVFDLPKYHPVRGPDGTFVLPLTTGHDSVLQVEPSQSGQSVGPKG
jgi:hypothetical protein